MAVTTSPNSSALDSILKSGSIRIAVTWSPPPETGFPPEFWLDEKGEQHGIAVEIGRLLAADLHVQPDFVDVPWADQFEALQDGKVDLLPKPTMTPERALTMEFSTRLMAFEVVALVRSDRHMTMASLNSPSVHILGWQGSSCNDIARRHFPQAQLIEYLSENDAKAAVADGVADAIVTDAVTKVSMEQSPALDFVRGPDGAKIVLAREYGHFAIRIGDQRFLNYLNSWIDYQRAMGVLDYWCDDWWLSWMAQ